MDWNDTRRKLLRLASRRPDRRAMAPALANAGAGEGPASLMGTGWVAAPDPPEPAFGAGLDLSPAARQRPCAASLCVASGKGGTGKTVVSASLAALFGARGRTLVVDADLGVGNAHILQDVTPARTLVDVVEGNATVREVLVPCSEVIDLAAAGSGVPRMAELTEYELHLIAAGLEELEVDYRYLVVDSAAGVSQQTMTFAAACDLTLVVTTPDLTAMTDAYAFLKVLLARSTRRPILVVNRARSQEQAEEVIERIDRVCERFIGRTPRALGWLPDDPAVPECVNRRGSVVDLEPHAPMACELRRKAVEVLEELGREPPGGFGRRLRRGVGFAQGF